MTQSQHTFEQQATITRRLHYLLHLPREYEEEPAKTWPLILFLHGMGERGSDLALVKRHGIAKLVESRPSFPFITVSPQCPAESWWAHHLADLAALLDEVTSTYAVDPRRVYLTGLSMGAFGGWHLLTEYPDRFAAAILICGGHTRYLDLEKRAARVKQVPLWIFHGDADPVVPVAASQQIVDTLQAVGGLVRFTVYPGVGHDAWTQTYDNPEIYDWLLAHETNR